MRFALGVMVLAACQGKATEKAGAPASIAIEGYGVHLVPVPATSATLLPNGTVIFGPLATAPRPAKILNVAVKTGKPPARLAPHVEGQMTVYSDDVGDTTRLALGVNQTTYEGVLKEATVSSRAGAWTLIVDHRETPWTAGDRIDVGADGQLTVVKQAP
ncbi:MAG TPA: hypothetical protein VGM90_00955 [Kofleriaceae bacterium]|jgi:hypothetical protein